MKKPDRQGTHHVAAVEYNPENRTEANQNTIRSDGEREGSGPLRLREGCEHLIRGWAGRAGVVRLRRGATNGFVRVLARAIKYGFKVRRYFTLGYIELVLLFLAKAIL